MEQKNGIHPIFWKKSEPGTRFWNFYFLIFNNFSAFFLLNIIEKIVEELFEDGLRAVNGGDQPQEDQGTNRTGTYVVKIRLHSEVPELLPIDGRRVRISYPGIKAMCTIDLQIPHTDWINLNLNAVNTSRQTTFITNKENRFKVGMNAFSNRTWYLNGKIKQDWLNLPFNSYKIKCKRLFLNGWYKN